MEERSPYFDDPILALVMKGAGKRPIQSDSEKENEVKDGPASKRQRLSDCDDFSHFVPASAFNATPDRQSLRSDDDSVPDTQYYVSREDILAAASKFKRKHPAVSDSSDTDSEYNYLLGPSSKRRKKDTPNYRKKKSPKSKRQKSAIKANDIEHEARAASPSDESRRKSSTSTSRAKSMTPTTSPDGRAMVTSMKAASKSQRLIPGYPLPTEPYPKNFSLSELCSQYPNHLFGTNLHPFLQYMWSPNRIVGSMPSQGHLAEDGRITVNAMNSRLKKVKAALERTGEYDELMSSRKTHLEGNLGGTGKEQGDSSDEEEHTEDAAPEPAIFVEHAAPYAGIFDQYKYSRDEDGPDKSAA
ncbi:hypothetical protein OHC33_009715 [Knufia fluminis]|uniref:Uncharacterized protein n=1 Tax=Knufia fluminis TaxID=191047 RepID=A0AAN8I2R1_9EURO|nr:hypothetical protein OHC33_009715 [Knufia fluminis]